MLAHPTGIVEAAEGTLATDGGGLRLELAATTLGLTASAKSVTAVERSIVVEGDTLRYELRIAGSVGLPLQHHLAATLHRS